MNDAPHTKTHTPQNVRTTTEKTNAKNKYIYFFCCPQATLTDAETHTVEYQHCLVSLAEGLTEKGYICIGNENYWQATPSSSYLITQETQSMIKQSEAIIISSHWLVKNPKIPLFSTSIPVFLIADKQTEHHIILRHPHLYRFEKVLLCGYVSCYKYPTNVIPWAFGLTHRIIDTIALIQNEQPSSSYAHREKELLINYRVQHTSRSLFMKYTLPTLAKIFRINSSTNQELENNNPYELLMSIQTGSRHYTQYYRTLCTIQAISAIGGYFAVCMRKNQYSLINRICSMIARQLKHTGAVLVQHDSWRFWEGLAAGTATFHLDFEENKVIYPVQPINLVDYIGFPKKYLKPHYKKHLLEFINSLNFEMIGENGRQFAMEYYTPHAVATRFMEFLLE